MVYCQRKICSEKQFMNTFFSEEEPDEENKNFYEKNIQLPY